MLIRLRNYFFAGLLVVVPIGVTAWFVWGVFTWLDSWFDQLLRRYELRQAIEEYIHIPEYGIGFVLTLLLICFVGFLTQLYVGKKLLSLVEFFFNYTPGVSVIYNGLKQIGEALMLRQKSVFEAVGMIEYPRRELYSLCFIVDSDNQLFSPHIGKELLYVFLPTTPNPTSGYYLIVPKEAIIPLDISIEEAMKMIISSGMVAPKRAPIINIPIENHIEQMKKKHQKEN